MVVPIPGFDSMTMEPLRRAARSCMPCRPRRFDVPDDFSDRDQDVKLHALGVNFSYKF